MSWEASYYIRHPAGTVKKYRTALPESHHAALAAVCEATVDNVAWQRGCRVERARPKVPPVELYRLPSYSPYLNVVERLWKLLRQRATHNQLFDDLQTLQAALRKHLDWLQVGCWRVRSPIAVEH